ncbi:MAG TPA: RDD family protein [Thermoanaerobaculia bacterium]
MMTKMSEEYIQNVVNRLPRAWPARARIEADLRLHLSELLEETDSETVAIERMGPAEQVAADFIAQMPLSPASYSRRFAAFVVDMIVIILPFVPLIWLAVRWQTVYDDAVSPYAPLVIGISIALGLLALAYFPALEALFGQTVGKRLAGTCVVREDGSRAGWTAAIIRRLPFFMNFFPIDALFVYFTKRRQRAFDKVAGTLVITCR